MEFTENSAPGDNWFNNWPDYPSVILNDGHISAHWSQMTHVGTYDYEIQVSER